MEEKISGLIKLLELCKKKDAELSENCKNYFKNSMYLDCTTAKELIDALYKIPQDLPVSYFLWMNLYNYKNHGGILAKLPNEKWLLK
jgi:hypothetical protein